MKTASPNPGGLSTFPTCTSTSRAAVTFCRRRAEPIMRRTMECSLAVGLTMAKAAQAVDWSKQ